MKQRCLRGAFLRGEVTLALAKLGDEEAAGLNRFSISFQKFHLLGVGM